ncbi:MAG: LbtU family siderophore porin [Nitrospirota bacterium]|nr:LbtU family siderophore porin [Nitrospirota bacterium]MDH5699217.1 LbtU family siderophore porin [Nitrospirota bacterium]
MTSKTRVAVGSIGGLLVALLLFPHEGIAADATSSIPKTTKPDQVRIYRSPEERRDAGLGTQVTDWLRIGGVADLGQEIQHNNFYGTKDLFTRDNPQLSLEVGFEVNYHDWLEAEVLFAIDESGNRHFQELDEGLIGVNLDEVGAKIGWLYVPFGAYYSHFVTGPLLEVGQTRAAALVVDYTFFDSLEIASYIFNSRADKHKNHNELDWGVNLEYVSKDESVRIGVGYLSDLAESDDNILEDFKRIYRRRVPAWEAYALFGITPFEFTAEVLQATRTFKELPENENKPFSFNTELAYFPIHSLQFAVRLEHSEELSGEPAWQYGIGTTWAPLERLTVSLEYLYGKYKKGFALDDNDNRQVSHHFAAGQITIGF